MANSCANPGLASSSKVAIKRLSGFDSSKQNQFFKEITNREEWMDNEDYKASLLHLHRRSGRIIGFGKIEQFFFEFTIRQKTTWTLNYSVFVELKHIRKTFYSK